MNQYERIHAKLLKNVKDGKRVSPLKAIRAFCLECVGFSAKEVEDCSSYEGYDCPLFKFRLGRNQSAPRLSLRSPSGAFAASRLKVKPKEAISTTEA